MFGASPIRQESYMDDNRALVETILNGDQRAFRVFIEKYQRLVGHVVFRMVKNREDVEDICQEIFMKIYRNLGGFRFDSQLSTWVATVAFNTCASHLQRSKGGLAEFGPVSEMEEDFPAPEEQGPYRHAEKSNMSAFVQREIDRLPPLYGTVIALYHLHDMNYREIADIMSLPEGTVKSYLFRGRKCLKEKLTARVGQEDLCH